MFPMTRTPLYHIQVLSIGVTHTGEAGDMSLLLLKVHYIVSVNHKRKMFPECLLCVNKLNSLCLCS